MFDSELGVEKSHLSFNIAYITISKMNLTYLGKVRSYTYGAKKYPRTYREFLSFTSFRVQIVLDCVDISFLPFWEAM